MRPGCILRSYVKKLGSRTYQILADMTVLQIWYDVVCLSPVGYGV